jgi:superfamily II DNA/RNA helicase
LPIDWLGSVPVWHTSSVGTIGSHDFASLGLGRPLLEALSASGIDHAFPVQGATIADILAGRDVAVQAPTGSGKTLAFGLPLLERSQHSAPGSPQALVLAPTRELARQIKDVLHPFAEQLNRHVHAFYGGVAFDDQIAACQRGVDIAVACPGRLLDLIERGCISLAAIRTVVVDEADRMADMGFLPDVLRLLARTPVDRQTLLFSATLDGDVDVLVRDHQRDPVRHVLHGSSGAGTQVGLPAIRHHLWSVHDDERTELTADVIVHCGPTMVFVRTRHGAERLAKRLVALHIGAAALHGGNSQQRRDRALDDFRAGRLQALVATDVAARGVHVDDVACVVQYDLPMDPKDYVHRAGRTARAGASGAVVTLVTPSMHGRATAMATLNGLSESEAIIERPDVETLESARQRRLVDRALAELEHLRPPGMVGSVSFDRPQVQA